MSGRDTFALHRNWGGGAVRWGRGSVATPVDPQMPRSPATSKERGDALESRVARILEREGRWRVRTNVRAKDRHGNVSEFDVVAGFLRPLYVECKNYSRPVPLSDVAKFKEVLQLNRIPLGRGLFVTTATYTPRCAHVGLRLLDGAALDAWERRAWWSMARRRCSVGMVAISAAMYAGNAAYREQVRASVGAVGAWCEGFPPCKRVAEEVRTAIACAFRRNS